MMLSFTFFYSLKQNDRLRVPFLFEVIGLDMMKLTMGEDVILQKAIEEEERKETLKSLQRKMASNHYKI